MIDATCQVLVDQRELATLDEKSTSSETAKPFAR